MQSKAVKVPVGKTYTGGFTVTHTPAKVVQSRQPATQQWSHKVTIPESFELALEYVDDKGVVQYEPLMLPFDMEIVRK